jgi:hypothetical protein
MQMVHFDFSGVDLPKVFAGIFRFFPFFLPSFFLLLPFFQFFSFVFLGYSLFLFSFFPLFFLLLFSTLSRSLGHLLKSVAVTLLLGTTNSDSRISHQGSWRRELTKTKTRLSLCHIILLCHTRNLKV